MRHQQGLLTDLGCLSAVDTLPQGSEPILLDACCRGMTVCIPLCLSSDLRISGLLLQLPLILNLQHNST